MLKEYFLETVEQAVRETAKKGLLGQMNGSEEWALQGEVPKNTEFGDFAVNVSSLARYARLSPVQIAQTLADNINKKDYKCYCRIYQF